MGNEREEGGNGRRDRRIGNERGMGGRLERREEGVEDERTGETVHISTYLQNTLFELYIELLKRLSLEVCYALKLQTYKNYFLKKKQNTTISLLSFFVFT